MLKNGLNVKPSKNAKRTSTQPSASVFDDLDVEDDNGNVNGKKESLSTSRSSLKRSDLDDDNEVYDYDGVYDSLKTHERDAAKAREVEKRERKPKYMQQLFDMAELRKQDRLRAEDLKIQRERDAEGDDLSNVEKFVTSSYRAHQAMLKSQAAAELEEKSRAQSHAAEFVAFTQGVLASQTKRQDAAVQASLSAKRGDVPIDNTDDRSDEIAETEARLHRKIAVNDNNEVVDHRDLLSAGLNRPKASTKHLQSSAESHTRLVGNAREDPDYRARIRRQQEALDVQLNETRKREHELAETRAEALQNMTKRVKSDAEVNSARERYLARKKC